MWLSWLLCNVLYCKLIWAGHQKRSGTHKKKINPVAQAQKTTCETLMKLEHVGLTNKLFFIWNISFHTVSDMHLEEALSQVGVNWIAVPSGNQPTNWLDWELTDKLFGIKSWDGMFFFFFTSLVVYLPPPLVKKTAGRAIFLPCFCFLTQHWSTVPLGGHSHGTMLRSCNADSPT